MKTLLTVMAILTCFAEIAGANTAGQNLPGSDSCGLGWQVTNKKTMLATTTRGTTNSVIPYTFGITTGTMGCDQHSFAKKDAEGVKFVVSNYEPLIIDMSKGQGEYLSALADTMGCQDKAHFGSMVQKDYSKIMSSSKDAVDFYQNVKAAAQCAI